MFSLIGIAVLGLAIGCGQSGEKAADQTAANTADDHAAMDDAAEVAATPGMMEVPADAEMASITVEGNMGCGHCTFHVKDSCSLAMKSTDGTVYMLEAGDQQEALMETRYDEAAVLVAGRVAEVDGQKIIYTDTVELR
jgi:hypothetical protein